jgi:hypothetical protein
VHLTVIPSGVVRSSPRSSTPRPRIRSNHNPPHDPRVFRA